VTRAAPPVDRQDQAETAVPDAAGSAGGAAPLFPINFYGPDDPRLSEYAKYLRAAEPLGLGPDLVGEGPNGEMFYANVAYANETDACYGARPARSDGGQAPEKENTECPN